MHQLGRFIQKLMDAEGMTRPELERESGLTRQHVHKLLTESEMTRWPSKGTIEALARAFPLAGELSFILKAAESLGFSIDDITTVEPDYSKLSNEALLRILADRLKGGQSGWSATGSPEETTTDVGGASVTSLANRNPHQQDKAARHTGQPTDGQQLHDYLDTLGEEPDPPAPED